MFRPRTCLLLAFLGIAGCDTPHAKAPAADEPVQLAPQKSTGTPVTAPPAQPVADCAVRPPAEQPCEDSSASCREASAKWARMWNDFTLKCEPIQPLNPIAGESVEALIPHPPGGEGPCMAGEMKITRIEQGDTTLLKIDNGTHGDCESLNSLAVAELGLLAPGHYRVDTGYFQTSFDVRPAGSDPGSLPEATLVAMAIAEKQQVGRCFGEPPAQEVAFGKPFEQLRIANQLKKAYPGVGLDELERRYQSAIGMVVREVSAGHWTYAYTNGACCSISQMEGVVTRRANGTYEVSDPKVVSTQNVPC
ncbi:MAG: hypothetical protein U0271_21990 [Polyangiaceae bacterium]